MTEETLNIIIKLFAFISSISGDRAAVLNKLYIEIFLLQQFSQNTTNIYVEKFEIELAEFEKIKEIRPITELFILNRIKKLSDELNSELTLTQKFQVLISLIGLVKLRTDSPQVLILNKCLNVLAEIFNINKKEFNNCLSFVNDKLIGVEDKQSILIITGNKNIENTEIKYFEKEGIKGYIKVLKIDSIQSYLFNVSGDDQLEINGRYIFKHHIYFFHKGLSIQGQGQKMDTIYYSEIERFFIQIELENIIEIKVDNIEYKFDDNCIGVHKLCLSAFSGQMIAIMGGSGSGKTTFLNILNGTLKPFAGNIFLNGFDIHKSKSLIQGLMGHVPQDDILFEELTVFQNLYYNSRLCFGENDKISIHNKITNTLKSLDLYDIRNLKVGTILNKFISGGQRKRLNIALELIREPAVLFIDEPTSGLSSSDSIKMIELLKAQTQKGKLIFINIHQPSSDIFKLFDKLLVFDKGGYPIYWGNPVESQNYFKKCLHFLDIENDECTVCGNVNPEEILQLIESKKIDEFGKETAIRKLNPEQWNNLFNNNIKDKISSGNKFLNKSIPKINYVLSSKIKQFIIYTIRNIISKISNKQYVYISLFEAPLLAGILGFFMKQTDLMNHNYDFSKNENLPSYLFMSIIVALFVGLIVSSEEIIKDKKNLRHEAFIGLHRSAYIHSKVFYLFILSFIQIFLYVLIGNFILEIKGMNFYYVAVLWSTACFANMLGLNISNSFKSVIAIYITIPFLLIPQILLAGIVVNFDKLNHVLASPKYVPAFADLMTSRWAYEALAVTQYKNNIYQKCFFDIDTKISNVVYQINFKIPTLIEIADNSILILKRVSQNQRKLQNNLFILNTEFNNYRTQFHDIKMNFRDSLTLNLVSEKTLNKANEILTIIQNLYSGQLKVYDENKEKIISNISKLNGRQFVIDLKKNNFNEKLSDIVLDNNELTKQIISGNEILRKYRPINYYPENIFGRAHFYAPVKRIGNFYIETLWFNVAIIWIMILILYTILLLNNGKK